MSLSFRTWFESRYFELLENTFESEKPTMLKKFLNVVDSYMNPKAETITIDGPTVPHAKISVVRSASATSSPTHSNMPKVRSDPNTLPHRWTVSSHGTLENMKDVIELGNVQELSKAKELITATGHHFKLYSCYQPTYCDYCAQVAYGAQLHRCMHCYTTTHPTCSPYFKLPCQRGIIYPDEDLSPEDLFVTARDLTEMLSHLKSPELDTIQSESESETSVSTSTTKSSETPEDSGPILLRRKSHEGHNLHYTPSFRIKIPKRNADSASTGSALESDRESLLSSRSGVTSTSTLTAVTGQSSFSPTLDELISPQSYSLSSIDVRSIRASGINVVQSVGEASPKLSDFAPHPYQLDKLNLILGTREFKMTKPDKFVGSLRVYMNLLRPVKMEQPAASVFLPRGNACLLHDVTSDTTSQDVIGQLLLKHRICDPPHKFGLFEHRVSGDKTVHVRRLASDEQPLVTLLAWMQEDGSLDTLATRRFILQESEDLVDWYAFSIPELQNFLRILDKEEEQYMKEINLKYELHRKQLQKLIWEHEKIMLKEESEA